MVVVSQLSKTNGLKLVLHVKCALELKYCFGYDIIFSACFALPAGSEHIKLADSM
jgi:hypothetical protein